MTGCILCDSRSVEKVLDVGEQPISTHFTRAPKEHVPLFGLSLAVCHDCGAIQLENPISFDQLVPPYDWISYREPEDHLDRLVEQLTELPGVSERSSVLGISTKDRSAVDRFKSHGFERTHTLDVHRDLGACNSNANFESAHGLMSVDRSERLVERHGTADVVIARHIFEHAEKPKRFLQALESMIADGGYLVIEVPDCASNLDKLDYTMVWEEHTLYLTAQHLPFIFSGSAFSFVDQFSYPYPFEDVLVLIGQKRSEDQNCFDLDESASIASNIALARRFGDMFDRRTEQVFGKCRELSQDGRKLAAYGAGHLTSAFINIHGLTEFFAAVIDDTPEKQGLFLPKNGLPIRSREYLNTDTISACLLGLSPAIEEKVIANNQQFVSNGGVFQSMFADSGRSFLKAFDTARKEVAFVQ